MKAWLLLMLAIALEVMGTTALKLSDGFTKLPWLGVVLLGYGGAFAALSVTLKSLPVGLSYAIWAGLGTLGAVVVGRVLFREALGAPQYVGMVLIVVGVVVLNLFEQARP